MADFLVILLIAFIVLLVVQIITLIRVRQFITRLRNTLMEFSEIKKKPSSMILPKQLRTCQFCKYRLTYIKANIAHNKEKFYYRCRLSDHEIELTSTCKKFEFDESA